MAGRKEQLEERILQFGNQIDGVEGLITSARDQLAYVERELASLRVLNQKGLARESQLLDLQRTQADLLGQMAERQSELARIRNSIRDTELEILQSERQFKEDVVTELRKTTTEREELVLQIVTVEKQLERIDVLAPADGIVHEMTVSTVGGVVAPEATIVQIVPLSEGVEFEVRVDPKSIDQIFVGQSAKVVFPAFDMRSKPEIFGSLANVPPSSVTDPATGQSYYRVGLSVPPEQLALLGNVELIPGMPVEAFLQTGERSVMSYLTKPLLNQLQRAFRDD
jgi:HlyD family secretion protein